MHHFEDKLVKRVRADRAAFLDKDGTLLEDAPYNVEPEHMRWMPGAREALIALHTAQFRLVVVSNQSGVARGLFPVDALKSVEQRLRAILEEWGVPLAGFYFCPHHPQGAVAEYTRDCNCRKPRSGLLRRAAYDLGLCLPASWMVGDILDDVEAGRGAGCRTVLVDNGHETEWCLTPSRRPDHRARDLAEAARCIIASTVLQGDDHG